MNLVFDSLIIVDLTNKEARKIEFAPSKNMLTSDGNHYGKSVIMKSLYYTLGAEVYFPRPIKSLNYLTIVCFGLDGRKYTVGRLNNMFVVFEEGQFPKKYHNVSEFGDFLSGIFRLNIELVGKDEEGTITKCPPAFFYLPYYIDQENGWSINSYSFDRMTQFDLTQRKDSYFFHLGVLDMDYVEQNKKQRANNKRISKLTKENEKYKTVIDTLKSGLDDTQMAFEIKDLERAISRREKEIDAILKAINKCRKDLVEAEDLYQRLINEKDVLAKYIKNNNVTPIPETEYFECPRCGHFFEQSSSEKMEQTYLLESLNEDYSRIIIEIEKTEKKIKRLSDKYEQHQKKIEDYESTLRDEQDLYDTYIREKTTRKMIEEYRIIMLENDDIIEELNDDNKRIRELLRVYQQNKTDANMKYMAVLNEKFGLLDIPSDQVPNENEPGSFIEASGAYGPRCKVAQVLSFLETQKSISDTMITFPVVIDSPNVLEQDKNHLESVFKILLTWNNTANQIIVASIEGKEIAEQIPGVNIICLKNDANHIMSKEEYGINIDEINEMLMSF